MTTFADGQLATLQILRAVAGAEATYGTLAPDEFPANEVPALPYVMVSTDSTVTRYPITATSSMRFVVYADTQAAAVALAWRLNGLLMDYRGGPLVRGFTHDGTGPVPGSDPDTGNPLCSFTLPALLRPIA